MHRSITWRSCLPALSHTGLWTLCHTIQHRAVLIIFPRNLQTINITRRCLAEGRGIVTPSHIIQLVQKYIMSRISIYMHENLNSKKANYAHTRLTHHQTVRTLHVSLLPSRVAVLPLSFSSRLHASWTQQHEAQHRSETDKQWISYGSANDTSNNIKTMSNNKQQSFY